MWRVKIEAEAAKIFESKELTADDRVVIQTWARTVVQHGPDALVGTASVWADHRLHGDWEGHRSSSFSYKGRIIYKVEDKVVTVIVVRITTDHDYRRRSN